MTKETTKERNKNCFSNIQYAGTVRIGLYLSCPYSSFEPLYYFSRSPCLITHSSEIIYTKIAPLAFFFLTKSPQQDQICLPLKGIIINCIKNLQILVMNRSNITITSIPKQSVQLMSPSSSSSCYPYVDSWSPSQDSASRSFSSCSGSITSRYFCISMVKYSESFRIILFLLLQMTKT